MDPSDANPNVRARRRSHERRPPPAPAAGGAHTGDDAAAPLAPEEDAFSGVIRVAAEPLLVAARFRDVLISSRMLVADPRLRRRSGASGAFHIGADRGADAPVDPAYFGGGGGGTARHALVEIDAGAAALGEPSWVLTLSAAMRAELDHGPQRLELRPDPPLATTGAVRAALALPARSVLRVRCGEMVFEIRAAGEHAPLARPWLSPSWRREGVYLAGAALALSMLVAILFAIPSDPRALSLDDIGRNIRLAPSWSVPPVVPDPPPTLGADAHANASGGSRAAAGPKGQAGDKHAPNTNRRLAVRGTASDTDPTVAARRAVDDASHRGVLSLLRGETGSALASVLSDGPALGHETEDVLGNLVATTIGPGWGAGGLSAIGTGAGGAGTGRGTIGTGILNTIGTGPGPGRGPGSGYGDKVSGLGRHKTVVPTLIPATGALVRGALSKEIVRRIIRLHLNEVRFCYEQELPRHPGLSGRLVVQFMVAGTGRVITSFVESSTIPDPRVGMCVTEAVRRWEFPRPDGGGLVQVSYPFQLQPAGGGS
jgi:TonB family protein